jgi:uncharacterized protein YegL
MDLVFLLDQSSLETATDWNNIKTFVKNLVRNLTISTDYVQVGIVTYGNPAINYVFFNTTEDVPTLLAQIDAIPFTPGTNNLASGITQVRLKFDISGPTYYKHLLYILACTAPSAIFNPEVKLKFRLKWLNRYGEVRRIYNKS